MALRENIFIRDLKDPHLTIQADRQKVGQILINLLNNANKFTEDGQIKLTVKPEGERLLVAVSDTGIGISKEAQLRIFEPFQQVNNELNRTYDGAGLGLAICKQFAEMMGADLSVSSKLGEGSTFILNLPTKSLVE